jgi:hypothetical protein
VVFSVCSASGSPRASVPKRSRLCLRLRRHASLR